MKLPFAPPDNRWRWRWMIMPNGRVLHRVARWKARHHADGSGVTVCGKGGDLAMPGIFTRMAAQRCRACCRKLDIPPGEGAPFNDEKLPLKAREA